MKTALVAFASRLKAFLSPRRLDEETARDCALHLELLTERYLRAGMAPDEARAAARKQFGNATLLREDVYHMNRIGWLEVLVQDLRYAVRSLRRSPAFTIAAVLTLAIGIGATTAIFSTVNETLLRALPFPHAEQIISIHSRMLDGRATGGGISPAEIRSLRSLPLPGIRLAGVQEQPLKAHIVGKDGTPIAITGSGVTEGFFRVLDLPVAAGRTFDHQDYFWSASQRTPVAGILSYHLWREVFDGNPAIIGKPLPISENLGPSVIVGVAAPQMDLPHGTDFWYALRVDPRSNSHGLEGLLRLDPGVPLARLESEGGAALANLARTTPSDVGRAYVMQPLLESIVGSVSPTLLIVLAATALLLLLACLNVTSLLLARSTARAREIAVRAALGASRLRLASHLLTEALLLAFLGMVVGLGFAYTAVRVLLGLGASKLPRLATVPFDGRVLLFALATLVICTLAIGLMPAWRQAHVGHRALLNEGGHHATPRRVEVRVMSMLIVAEIALAMVLTAGSGWLLKAYDRLVSVDPGFRPRAVWSSTCAPAGRSAIR